MRPIISFFLSLVFATSALATDTSAIRLSMPMSACANQIPFGAPKSARSDTTEICRQGYALEHDNKAKIPAWVAYTLTSNHALGCHPRLGTFKVDPSIRPEATAHMKDYAKSGYDIGHMANNGDMRWDQQVEIESNVFSNAAPQLPGLNRAAWKMLEDLTRAWATQREHTLLIYVGPVYEKQASTTIGIGQVTVPLSFYKIIIDLETNEILTFLYPHQDSGESPSSFKSTLPLVQSLTQIVFPIPMRPVFSPGMWPSNTKSARYEKTKTCILAQKP